MDWPMCEKETITFTKASPDHTLLKQIWPWFTSKILISMQVAKAFGHSWGDRVLDIHLPAQVGFVTLSHYGITAVFIKHVEPILEASRKEWSWHIPTQVAIGQSDLCKKTKGRGTLTRSTQSRRQWASKKNSMLGIQRHCTSAPPCPGVSPWLGHSVFFLVQGMTYCTYCKICPIFFHWNQGNWNRALHQHQGSSETTAP
jgi:hypothetical protein